MRCLQFHPTVAVLLLHGEMKHYYQSRERVIGMAWAELGASRFVVVLPASLFSRRQAAKPETRLTATDDGESKGAALCGQPVSPGASRSRRFAKGALHDLRDTALIHVKLRCRNRYIG